MTVNCPKCGEELELECPKDWWLEAYCDKCDIVVGEDGQIL